MARSATRWLVAEGAGLLQQVVHQRRLAVVDVGDDRDVTEFHWGALLPMRPQSKAKPDPNHALSARSGVG